MSNQDVNKEEFPLFDPFNDPSDEFNWFHEALRRNDWRSFDDGLATYRDMQMDEHWDDLDDLEISPEAFYRDMQMDIDWDEREMSPESSYARYCQNDTPGEMVFSDCLREEMYWKNIPDDALNKRLILNGFKKPH